MWPVGRTTNTQTSYTGIRMNANDQRAGGQRAWADHQQPVQTPGVQWNAQNANSSGQWAATTTQGQNSATQGLVAWPATQQQWSSTTTVSNTYAEHAKKASTINVRNQTSTTRFEQPTQAWGGVKVEQGTPWDASSVAVVADSGLTIHGTDTAKAEWVSAGGVAAPAAASRWNLPSGHQWGPLASSSAAEWAHHRQVPNAPWNKQTVAGAGLVPSAAVPAASWVQSQAAISAAADQYDPNPQTPGPWVAPQPAELNNDMMWHDPNPKQKKVQRDTGTSIWGDPAQQPQEIKRWKDVEIGDYSHVQSATSSGGDWNTIPISSSTFNSINNQNPVASTPAPGNGNNGWNNCTLGEQQIGCSTAATPLQDCQEKWTAPPSQSSGWGDSAKVENAGENMQINSGLVRMAVAKGLIDMSAANRPMPPNLQATLSTLMQKMSKLEQAQQEYNQVLHAVSSHTQKVECERLVMEINDLQQEIVHLRNSVNDQTLKRMSAMNGTIPINPADGQSRLNQWKLVNTGDDCDKLPASSSDVNVPALIASAQNLSLDEKGDWKSGTLDWSPPGSASGAKARSQASLEKDDENAEKLTASQTQSATGTPTPNIDDGPQEFVPGKKWEWRDPNKVAEDPNATPGNCKPNPLLSSSNAAPFQAMYGRGAVSHFLTDLPVNKGYINWNGLPAGNNYTNELWAANRSSRTVTNVFPQQVNVGGPVSHNSFQRSFSSPTHRHYCSVPWIFIYLHSVTQEQAQLLCQKAGTLAQFASSPGFPWLFVKFREPVEDVARHLREMAPYLQFKLISDSEMDRMMRVRGPPAMIPINTLGWSTPGLPAADPSPAWMFGTGAMALPGGEMLQAAQQQQQQHAFHTDDLARPF